jgi:hypothetical protein
MITNHAAVISLGHIFLVPPADTSIVQRNDTIVFM